MPVVNQWRDEGCTAYWCPRWWRFDLTYPANREDATVEATLRRDGWEYLPARGGRFSWDPTAGWYCPSHIGWARRRRAAVPLAAGS